LRATGSRECAPDDRLREAIQPTAQRKNGLLRRLASRNDVEGTSETKKPAVIRDGRLLSMREKFRDRYATQRLPK
jgi:hypothetical protein